MARQNTRVRHQDGGSIFGMADFGAPITRRLSVFSDAENVFDGHGFGELAVDATDYYKDAKNYLGRYDQMIVNIARIASESARAELAKTIGDAKDAGTRIINWLISSGSPAYYAVEVRDYIRQADAPPYSPANPNYVVFTQRRAINRVSGLKDAVEGLEPQVAEAMRIHGVLAPDKTAEFQAQLDALRRQIEGHAAAAGAPGGAPLALASTQPAWVLPVVLGGVAVIGIGAFMMMRK